MATESTASVVGPEGTTLTFPLANASERAVALIIDLAVLFAAFLVLGLATMGAVSFAASTAFALAIVGFFVLRHGYFLVTEFVLSGSTPGKRLMGLRVVSRDGGRLRLEAIAARNLMRDVETFVPLAFLLSPEQFLGPTPTWLTWIAAGWTFVVSGMPLYTRERTRAGDLLGGTIVVRIPKAPLLRDETADASRAGLAFSREQLNVYGEHELETLAELLRAAGRGETTPDDLRLIARTIARKIEFLGDEPERAPLEFLRAFYRDQRAELERRLTLGRRKADKFDGPGAA